VTTDRQQVQDPPGDERRPVLEGRRLEKRFGNLAALDAVSLALYPGEIVALLGDNGAGKSTLVKAMAGASPIDGGEILFEGQRVNPWSPKVAQRHGVATAWQDLALDTTCDITSNFFLGREIVMGRVLRSLAPLNKAAMRSEVQSVFARMGIEVDQLNGPPVSRLSGGQRQSVAIAKASHWSDRVLFMDEPTAALGVRQAAMVLDLARGIARGGSAVVIISHAIPQVLECADRVVVLRHGRKVLDCDRAATTPEMVVDKMLGMGAD
jgi:simple sugar transport system ATP-binding protein